MDSLKEGKFHSLGWRFLQHAIADDLQSGLRDRSITPYCCRVNDRECCLEKQEDRAAKENPSFSFKNKIFISKAGIFSSHGLFKFTIVTAAQVHNKVCCCCILLHWTYNGTS